MTATPLPTKVPRSVLLATDLSARCDRALDRAAQLAGDWAAELIALNILDASNYPDQALAWASGNPDEQLLHMARRQLVRDLKTINVPSTMRITRSGDIAAAIRSIAEEMGAELAVTGVSCNESLGRLLLGSTVESLARSLGIPLLIVRNRAYEAYQRIVVATDFSESSRHALQAVVHFFPGRELILYHAHALPMVGEGDTSGYPEICADIRNTDCATFLANTELPAGQKLRPVIECGAIETTLTRYVRENDIDLVVMGSHGSSGIMSLLLGSTAAKLLDWLPCDMLLMRMSKT